MKPIFEPNNLSRIIRFVEASSLRVIHPDLITQQGNEDVNPVAILDPETNVLTVVKSLFELLPQGEQLRVLGTNDRITFMSVQ